ncbi:hypothetical protein CHUAL_000574 [Chamberlinius hualienensis]
MLGFSPCGKTPFIGMHMWFTISLLLLFHLFLLLPPTSHVFTAMPLLPTFAETLPNITIIAGRDAILPCVVDNLGIYRVVWIKKDTQTVLTFHTQVITQNNRIRIVHNGHRNWDLHIKNIQETDRGDYMCQVNTIPMIYQLGNIEVVVPPDIIFDETSSDLAVSESSTASLLCRATGHPRPILSWRREDDEPIMYKQVGKDKIGVYALEGDILTLTKITRRHMGAYLCIASNGVPPSVSKRIHLQVNFEPAIKVPNQLVGAASGGEVIMECLVEASPRSVNYWMKDTGEVIFSNEKYDVQQQENGYKIHMQLRIRYLEKRDFGEYRCIAKNSMGEAEGDIQLHEIQMMPSNSKGNNDDSGLRIEERIGHNDTVPHYKTLDSKRNPEADDYNYSDKDYGESRGGAGSDGGENDVHYPPPRYPVAGDTGHFSVS